MNVKSVLVLVASGLYFLTCHYWYCCSVKAACYGCAPSTEMALAAAATTNTVEEEPLLFDWSNASPIIATGFEEEKADWLEGKSSDNILEITGHYFRGEETVKGFKDLGLARADAIRKLLILEFPDERIRLKSKEASKSEYKPSEPFKSVSFNWTSVGELGSDVIDFGQKAIILFPNNSIKKETNSAIDEYFKEVSERVKSSGEIIFLTGHTDHKGSVKDNLRLAKKRAMRIRRILRQKGVDREQLVVNSKGEQEPVASNETEKGRYQNRRVVIEIKMPSH